MLRWIAQVARARGGLAFSLMRGMGVAAVCVVATVLCAQAFDKAYPLAQWLIWRLLPLWGYSLLLNVACVAVGAAVLRWLLGTRQLPAVERLLQSMMLGLVVFVLALHLLGTVCLLRPWMSILLPLLMLAVGLPASYRLYRGLKYWARSRGTPSLPRRIAIFVAGGWGAVCLAFVYLEALHPSVINFDAAWYHMPTAQDYARIGCIVPFPGENHRAYPHLTSMVQTWAFLVPGLEPVALRWMLALHLEFSIVVWQVVGVVAAAHWMLGEKETRGLWPVYFLFPSIFVYDQCIGGGADHYLGFFAVPIFLALARALRSFERPYCALLGFAAGGHMLTKYQAMYLIVGVAAVIACWWAYLVAKRLFLVLRRRPATAVPGWRRLLFRPLLIVVVAAAVSAPHYLRNVVFYNNPVYPFAQSVFTASHPSRGPGLYTVEPKPRKVGPRAHGRSFWEGQLWTAEYLFRYSFRPLNHNWTQGRPYMGSLFSLLLPGVLLVRRSRRIWLALAVGCATFMVSTYAVPHDRYMLGYHDLFIAIAAALMVRVWQLGWLARAALVPLVALQLVWGGDAMLHYGGRRLDAARRLVSSGYKGKYDNVRLGERRVQGRVTEATPADAKILTRNYRSLLGIDRLLLSDIERGQDYIVYTGIRDSRDLYEMFHSAGITHLLYPEGQRKPHRWNNTILWAEFFHRHARQRQRIGGLVLARMPDQPPPHTHPYLVLVSGLREYRNGLYRVEQLDVDDREYMRTFPKPRPLSRLRRDNAQQLLARADAVATTSRRFATADQLKQDFVLFEKFRTFEVYLRKRLRTK